VKKPPKKAPPQPVIGAPAVGQVHRLGPPPHDLVCRLLLEKKTDIAPQFKPRTPPAAKEAAPPAKKKRKQRVGRQGVILDGLLQKLQREGLVTGRATSQIHGRVANRWPADTGSKPRAATQSPAILDVARTERQYASERLGLSALLRTPAILRATSSVAMPT